MSPLGGTCTYCHTMSDTGAPSTAHGTGTSSDRHRGAEKWCRRSSGPGSSTILRGARLNTRTQRLRLSGSSCAGRTCVVSLISNLTRPRFPTPAQTETVEPQKLGRRYHAGCESGSVCCIYAVVSCVMFCVGLPVQAGSVCTDRVVLRIVVQHRGELLGRRLKQQAGPHVAIL